MRTSQSFQQSTTGTATQPNGSQSSSCPSEKAENHAPTPQNVSAPKPFMRSYSEKSAEITAEGITTKPRTTKKPRTSCDVFMPEALYDDLKPLAANKLIGFSWGGEDYAKVRRSQGPDRAGLELHSKLLEVMFRHCPKGFPAHNPLKRVLKKLTVDFCLNTNSKKSDEEFASLGSDWIRLM